MKAADIRKDPWKARDQLITILYNCVNTLECLWISEDGWEEEPEYRTAIVKKLLSIDKHISRTNKHLHDDNS